jgi:hypothetical protein
VQGLSAWLCVAVVAGLGSIAGGCGSATDADTTAAPHQAARHTARATTIALAWHGPSTAGIRLGRGRARFLSPTRLAFTTAGSGSCPSLPTRLDILGRSAIRLELALYDPRHTACTSDLATTRVAIAISPHRVDVHRDLSIHLATNDGRRQLTLLARGLR